MNALTKKAMRAVVQFQVFLAFLLFLPAWSLRFWEAWVYWILFSLLTIFITLYFLKRDPALIARRMRAGPTAEKEKSQKVIMLGAMILMLAVYLIPGFDHRLHWSFVPPIWVWLGNAVNIAGWLFVVRVLQENSFAASTITVEKEQRVISTGPYALVRHPMYFGGGVSFLATPIALGSLWALVPAVLFLGVLVFRLLNEEEYLLKNLPGYDVYCRKVRRRLIPYIW